MDANSALNILKEGNIRFASGKSVHPRRDKELRDALCKGQKPIAAIISCSDSRVPVEIVFDAGIGDIFVVRTAGHVLSNETLGSIEYAVEHLGVNLVVILGHENCGAVKSALAVYRSGKYNELTDNLKALLKHIYPVFQKIYTPECHASLHDATYQFVKYQVEDFKKKAPLLASKIADNKIKLVGAFYPLSSGVIEFFE